MAGRSHVPDPSANGVEMTVSKTDLDFEVVQAFIEAVQGGVATARRRGVRLLFEHQGPAPRVTVDTVAMRTVFDLMVAWVLYSSKDGTGSLHSSVACDSPGRCRFLLCACNADTDLHGATEHHATAFTPALESSEWPPLLTLVANLCRWMPARVEVAPVRAVGQLARVEWVLPCEEPAPADTRPLVIRAQAWLVGRQPHALESVIRRIRRLGWRTRVFADAEDVIRTIASQPTEAAPSLVMGLSHLGVTPNAVARLRRSMPDRTRVAWLVDKTHRRSRAHIARVDRCAWPLSEVQLRAFTDTARGQAPQADQGGPCARPRVLVVDGEETSRVCASEMLTALGYAVDLAVDGVDGLDRCLTSEPHLVLMDLNMPRMNGLEAARKLRQWQREGVLSPFPIVAVTSHAAGDVQWTRADAEMDGMLAKPFDLRTLHRLMAKSLAGYRLRPLASK